MRGSDRLGADVRPASPVVPWARGTALAERACPTVAGAGSAPRTQLRLRRWQAAHDLDATGQLDRLLAESGLDRAALAGLLGEDAGALAARLTEPPWVREVAAVLAAAPVDALCPNGFGAVVGPFATRAGDRLAGRIAAASHVDAGALVADFTERLRRDLTGIAARTLVLELNVARVEGLLDGATAEERFGSFVRRTAGRAGLTALLGEYPVLARLLARTATRAEDAAAECVEHFTADRAELVTHLLAGRSPGPLVALDTGAGDRHQGGRAVTVLRFACGTRLVYKPRPVAVHRHFNDIVAWLGAVEPDVVPPALRVLDRGGYGWVEFAEHLEVTSAGQASAFYRRLGGLLALLYLLDGTDQHAENVVAHGELPMLVDLETLFHPALPPSDADPDPAAAVLRESVYRVGLLPIAVAGDQGVLDVSGIGGEAGATLPFDVARFDGAGTDTMRVVRRPATSPGWPNRPRLPDVDVQPEDHVDPLLDGFRRAYEAVAARRDELAGMLDRFAADRVRVVVRDSARYARLLDESTHPDLLRDGLDRDRELACLWALSAGDALRERLVRHELRELWAGDIPTFSTTPTSRDLYTGDGTRLPGALPDTGLDRVRAKLAALGPADRRRQEWIIRAAFAGRSGADGDVPGPAAPADPDPDRLLAAARRIGAELASVAHRGFGAVNWLGLEGEPPEARALAPLGPSLTTGYTGVALFLSQLAAITGEAEPAELARSAIAPIPRALDRLGDRPGVGFSGLGGLAYALAELSAGLGDPEVRGWARTAVRLCGHAVERTENVDVLDGLAGCLAAMLAVRHDLSEAWPVAVACAERIAVLAAGDLPAGFAHGRHGVGWALCRFAAAADDPRLALLGAALLDPAGDVPGHGWCAGTPGVLMARLDAGLDATAPVSVPAGPGLCHGEAGVLQALAAAAEAGLVPPGELRGRTAVLLARVDRHHGAAVPGLLFGLAGVGHGLLRLGFPDRVPAVLLLESRGAVRRGHTAVPEQVGGAS